MMTSAQKKARGIFMKAIAYRKKHPGVTLKEAFAWAKKNSSVSVSSIGAKKRKPVARKKAAPKSYHKDTKSHNVNIRVVSGVESGKKKMLLMWKDVYGKLASEYVSSKNVKEKKHILKQMKDAREIIQKLK